MIGNVGNRSMGREAGDATGSRRLEGHLVEMGLGKNRISRERDIYRRLRHREAGTTTKFPNRARKHGLYCATNGRYADVAFYN